MKIMNNEKVASGQWSVDRKRKGSSPQERTGDEDENKMKDY